MEMNLYRMTENGQPTGPRPGKEGMPGRAPYSSSPAQAQANHSPVLFYPEVAAQERHMWTDWLPTAIIVERTGAEISEVMCRTLTTLSAPPEVLEECRWSWKMELFDAYEIRTPVRRDFRDPLVLGRLGTQYYRVALWGESLKPLKEVAAIVERSLHTRHRYALWKRFALAAGTLGGFGVGLWVGAADQLEGNLILSGIACATLGGLSAWVPFMQSSESRQQDFLDGYRQ